MVEVQIERMLMTTVMNMFKLKSEGKYSYDYFLANISICCAIHVKGNIMNKHVQKYHLQHDLNFELNFCVCVGMYKGTTV